MSELTNPPRPLSAEHQALVALRRLRARVNELESAQHEPIAIVGMGCRFPGADGPEAFRALLRGGVNAVSEVPADRWNLEEYYDPDPQAPGKMYARHGGFLDGVDRFDPQFFGISPREAAIMDPQHRLVLEVAWEALEHAGCAPAALAGTETGVFIGLSLNDYAELVQEAAAQPGGESYVGTGTLLSAAAGRLSYVLGVHGPSVAVDTACSSSLVSVHLACQSLRQRECRLALAGGVNVILNPRVTVNCCHAGILARDGRCKTFDAAADGFVRGEGCGVVVLKRLSDAQADGDRVLALIRGSAVNQDGRSSGFTAPNELAQVAVIRKALSAARVPPADVSFIEAHGTGTSLGDPVEVHALAAVYGVERPPDRPLILGSVKTNLGHLESAAGVAGLIRVVLGLQDQEVAPHLHFQTLNPHIASEGLSLQIPTALMPWPSGSGPRIAGVSSFGLIGTNAHVLVQEAPPAPERETAMERPHHIVTLSGRSDEAVVSAAARLDAFLSRAGESAPPLADIAFTSGAGRSHFSHRAAIVAGTVLDLQGGLRRLAQREPSDRVIRGTVRPAARTDVTFLFSGEGSQYVGMGRQLFETQPTFRRALERCADLLAPELSAPLLEVMYPQPGVGSRLDEPAFALPAVFALEYALAELWRSWHVEPSAVIGHGAGEYAAACVAGLFSLEDALRLVAARGRGPQSVLVDPSLEELERVVATVGFHRPQVPIASNLTGTLVHGDEMSSAEYWRRQAREPIRFAAGLAALHADGKRIFVEAGPRATLSRLGLEALAADASCAWLWSCEEGSESWPVMLRSLGELYVRGVEIDWAGFDRDYAPRRVALPTYPFQRERYWVHAPRSTGHAPSQQAGSDVASWLHQIVWRPRAHETSYANVEPLAGTVWTIFGDAAGAGREIAARLRSEGAACTVVTAGRAYAATREGIALDPRERAHIRRLWSDLPAGSAERILHLWSLEAAAEPAGSPTEAATPSCASLLHIAQELGDRPTSGRGARVWIVTRGAQAAGAPHRLSLAQAPVLGLTRTLALEYPDVSWRHVDMAPGDSAPDLDGLWTEVRSTHDEDSIALRPGERLVARLVPTPSTTGRESVRLQPDAAYLVTGGFGGLGLQVARWLVGRGARHLALVGRRGLPEHARADIQALEQQGARVASFQADVSREVEIARVLSDMQALPPLRGVIHAAGILDDGLVAQQTWERVAASMAGKAEGAWHLHRLTRDRPLDFFVLFSSAVSILGSAGQANYAAANAFLDALAHDRQAQGLPALSINWGPWAEVGMAAGLDSVSQDRFSRQGWGRIPVASGLEVLGRLLQTQVPQIGVLPVDWARVFGSGAVASPSPFLEELRPAQPKAQPAIRALTLEDLRSTAPGEHQPLIESYLAAHVGRALGAGSVDVDEEIGLLGLDSLLALEVRNAVQRDLGVSISVVSLMEGNSIRTLAQMIATSLPAGSGAESREHPLSVPDMPLDAATSRTLLEQVPALSDAQVEALLANLLARSGN